MANVDDVDRLQRFVLDLGDLLDETLSEHRPWFTVATYDLLGAAWDQLLSFRESVEVMFGQLREDPELRQQLTLFGLTDAQLDVKLAGFDLTKERYRAHPAPRRLRRVLRWADVILGSLVWVPVLRPLDRLREIKEVFEVDLEQKNAR